MAMTLKRFDNKGTHDPVTHDEVAQAICHLEAELQELGIEVVRRYSYQLYSDINQKVDHTYVYSSESVANAHYSVRLKFRVKLFGQERLITSKYPWKKRGMWRDMNNVDHLTTADYFKHVSRQMMI